METIDLFARKCDVTGEGFTEGFIVGNGDKYFKYERDMLNNAILNGYEHLSQAYADEYYYWTSFEDDLENYLLEQEYAYDEKGNEYELINGKWHETNKNN